MDDKRQYRCAVTSEMCQLKVLAITNELGIMGFKATLSLSQVVAAGGRVVVGIGAAWQRPSMRSICLYLSVTPVVIILASGSEVRGFDPSRGR